jgi:hypothetical protein
LAEKAMRAEYKENADEHSEFSGALLQIETTPDWRRFTGRFERSPRHWALPGKQIGSESKPGDCCSVQKAKRRWNPLSQQGRYEFTA